MLNKHYVQAEVLNKQICSLILLGLENLFYGKLGSNIFNNE